jgi:hypothetical protein
MRSGASPRVPGPAFDLTQFQAEVRQENFHVYITRALQIIKKVRQCDRLEAREYAKRAVLSLQQGDYAHTLKTANGQLHDVYGKLMDEEGWYLKIEIHIRDGQPGIVSCHPAEHDLETNAGVVPRSRRERLR